MSSIDNPVGIFRAIKSCQDEDGKERNDRVGGTSDQCKRALTEHDPDLLAAGKGLHDEKQIN